MGSGASVLSLLEKKDVDGEKESREDCCLLLVDVVLSMDGRLGPEEGDDMGAVSLLKSALGQRTRQRWSTGTGKKRVGQAERGGEEAMEHMVVPNRKDDEVEGGEDGGEAGRGDGGEKGEGGIEEKRRRRSRG
ncbi:hypothetical protein Scep_019324 [Stephania cephalantha]|uniref:Uncharacterized protein n=1 Tax=Stephania cephalantha TaxID=152367 RepID=A0AAP0NN66_9MAGN